MSALTEQAIEKSLIFQRAPEFCARLAILVLIAWFRRSSHLGRFFTCLDPLRSIAVFERRAAVTPRGGGRQPGVGDEKTVPMPVSGASASQGGDAENASIKEVGTKAIWRT
ncbi:hypothetical protein [Xanthomonas arboricola]|uniref:hypothetical protein n=1 Tax=Xanthomonas arboricola TaxID=56448 RepID=UPI00129012B7|nr:hypothetical protein [Xanthomonas arboricola]